MKGSSTMLLLLLAAGGALLFAYKRGNGTAGTGTPSPGRAATAGTTKAAPVGTKPAKVDPLKALTNTAKTEATKAGQRAIIDWFAGTSGGP